MWSLQYVSGGAEAEELLVSVSTDGRVLSWRHTQSLDHVDLMRLKRAQAQRRMSPGPDQPKQVQVFATALQRIAGNPPAQACFCSAGLPPCAGLP